MKKRSLIALSVMICGAVAFAGSIQIPFFLDNGGNLAGDGYPPSGTATFICIKNPDPATPLTITIAYFDNDGTDQSHPTDNTYEIPAGAAVSWRPVATDPAEGVGSAIGNKQGGKVAGTAIITYVGAFKVSGRIAALYGSPVGAYGYLITSD